MTEPTTQQIETYRAVIAVMLDAYLEPDECMETLYREVFAEGRALTQEMQRLREAANASLDLFEEMLKPSEPDEQPDPDVVRVAQMLAKATGRYDEQPGRAYTRCPAVDRGLTTGEIVAHG